MLTLRARGSWCKYRWSLTAQSAVRVSTSVYSGRKQKKSPRSGWSHTVNVPKTSFPLHRKDTEQIEFEVRLQKSASFQGLYRWQREQSWSEEFILQDGPPYANGKAHMGHAVNRVLKDIVLRYKLMRRVRVRYRPGWDCHGLPIELRALSQTTEDHTRLSPLAVRATASEFAGEAVSLQRTAFQRWGVLADWSDCYYTSDRQYTRRQLQVFGTLYRRGYIYRALKPIHWSPSSRTALAEAELEYNPHHVSQSLHFRLPLVEHPFGSGTDAVYLLVWTTTPWTLPANQAVCYNPDLQYSLVRISGLDGLYVVAADLCGRLSASLGRQVVISCSSVTSAQLSSCRYRPPPPTLSPTASRPLLPASHVTLDKGTGLVHTAPAHGAEDFQVALKHGITPVSLVDEDGCYTAAAGDQLHARSVLSDGDRLVLQCLGGDAVHCEDYVHSYPYDWRTKQPVITMASQQWFIDAGRLMQPSLDALSDVTVLPDSIQSTMSSQLAGRTYWCISRQRSWGVPIPVFYDAQTQPVIDQQIIEHLSELFGRHGADIWWQWDELQLLPPSLVADYQLRGLPLPTKGKDILDIWFDSGVAWHATQPDGLERPADLYLEGLDQFTGWFHSSLLTAVACTQRAPYRCLFVHGFVMDEQGRKMSKSLGNVIDPTDVVDGQKEPSYRPARGADCLRMWVAAHAINNTHITVGETILQRTAERLVKLRNTCRFLLGMMHHCPTPAPLESAPHPPTAALPAEAGCVDRYMLHRLSVFTQECAAMYDGYQFNRLMAHLNNFVVNEVSGFYIAVARHRLYCGNVNSTGTQSALTVLQHTLFVIQQVMAPVLPHLAEELAQHHPSPITEDDVGRSVFHAGWPAPAADWSCDTDVMCRLLLLREHVHKLMPAADNPARFEVVIALQHASDEWRRTLSAVQSLSSRSCDSELAELLPVSWVTLSETVQTGYQSERTGRLDGVDVTIVPTNHSKCGRCFRYTTDDAGQLCDFCADVVGQR